MNTDFYEEPSGTEAWNEAKDTADVVKDALEKEELIK